MSITHDKGDGVARDIMILLALTALFTIPSLFTRDLWNPDEPRYMEVAREMVLLGDYLVPRLDGYLYPDKPPMFFWLAAGLYRMGFGYISGRVVAGLSSAGTVLLTYFLAKRLVQRPGPMFAALMTLTSLLFAATARIGVIDPLLTFFVVLSICLGIRALDREEPHFRLFWLGAYLAAALAVLTKGPVGVATPAVVLLCIGLVMRGRSRAGGWVHLCGGLLLVAVVAAWLAPAIIRATRLPGGREYIDNLLFRQTAGRLVDSYSHRNPFYYYLLAMPWIFFPWSLLLPLALWSAVKDWRSKREVSAGIGLVWFVAVLVFFSLISGKRPGYILPMFPAFALLMGRYLMTGATGAFPKPGAHRILTAATLLGLVLIAAACVLGTWQYMWTARATGLDDADLQAYVVSFLRGLVPVAIALVLAVSVLAVAAWRRSAGGQRPGAMVTGTVVILVAISLAVDAFLFPKLNELKSGRLFCLSVKQYLDAGEEVWFYKHNFSGVYNLYTGRVHIPILKSADALTATLDKPKRVVVIGNAQELEDALARAAGERISRSEQALLKRIYALQQRGQVPAIQRVGHRKIVLLTNWPSAVHNDSTQSGPADGALIREQPP